MQTLLSYSHDNKDTFISLIIIVAKQLFLKFVNVAACNKDEVAFPSKDPSESSPPPPLPSSYTPGIDMVVR